MTWRTIELHGETYVSIATVAECYEVELAWIEEVYTLGLLGPGERVERLLVVSVSMLDRVALILRLERQQGINLPGIARLLDGDAPATA